MPRSAATVRAGDDRPGAWSPPMASTATGSMAVLRRSADVDGDAVVVPAADGHTTCGGLALPQRGQRLRAGAFSFQALARRLRVFDLEFFFLGTAIVRFLVLGDGRRATGTGSGPGFGRTVPQRPHHVIGGRRRCHPATSRIVDGARSSSGTNPSRPPNGRRAPWCRTSSRCVLRSTPQTGHSPAQSVAAQSARVESSRMARERAARGRAGRPRSRTRRGRAARSGTARRPLPTAVPDTSTRQRRQTRRPVGARRCRRRRCRR